MGIRNYLIEGVSGTGKTSVCDSETGKPTNSSTHENHIWNVDKVKALAASQDEAVTFFCGGSRNFSKFIELFDGVFVLEVDLDTLNRRLDERCRADPDDWGGRPEERELIVRLRQTREGAPENGIIVGATAPIARVVDEILRQSTRAGKDAVHRNR